MNPTTTVSRGLGFGFYTDFGRAEFSFFKFAMHYHAAHDDEECPFRFGISLGLFGLHFDIGIFES